MIRRLRIAGLLARQPAPRSQLRTGRSWRSTHRWAHRWAWRGLNLTRSATWISRNRKRYAPARPSSSSWFLSSPIGSCRRLRWAWLGWRWSERSSVGKEARR